MSTTSSEFRVRRLQIKDFAFVRDLASEQPNFTIPPPYVLWLLLKIRRSIALIVEQEDSGPTGYMLAVPVAQPKTLYVWQMAMSKHGNGGEGTLLLMSQLRSIAIRQNTSFIMFSTVPGSATYRAIRRNALKVFGIAPLLLKPLPAIIGPHESEYCVRLGASAMAKHTPKKGKARK